MFQHFIYVCHGLNGPCLVLARFSPLPDKKVCGEDVTKKTTEKRREATPIPESVAKAKKGFPAFSSNFAATRKKKTFFFPLMHIWRRRKWHVAFKLQDERGKKFYLAFLWALRGTWATITALLFLLSSMRKEKKWRKREKNPSGDFLGVAFISFPSLFPRRVFVGLFSWWFLCAASFTFFTSSLSLPEKSLFFFLRKICSHLSLSHFQQHVVWMRGWLESFPGA